MVARIGIAYRYAVDEASRRRIENLAGENRPPERIGADLVASQQRAEVAGLERVRRRRVAEPRKHAGAEPRVIEVGEEERLVVPVVQLRDHNRTAKRGAVIVVAQRRLADGEEALRVERVVGKVPVAAAVECVGARLGGVLDEAAAGVAILRRVARGDDLDLLHRVHGRRALLALLVPAGVPERRAIEEILGRHRLAAVDAGIELAAAEHRVAVRLHRQVAGLHLQHGLGKTDIAGRDDWEVAVVLLVHRVADVRLRDVETRRRT